MDRGKKAKKGRKRKIEGENQRASKKRKTGQMSKKDCGEFEQKLYSLLKENADEAQWFLERPPKSLDMYYVLVKEPKWFQQIRKKLRRGEYSHLHKILRDVEILFFNARLYNAPGYQAHQDSLSLQLKFKDKLKDLVHKFGSKKDKFCWDTCQGLGKYGPFCWDPEFDKEIKVE